MKLKRRTFLQGCCSGIMALSGSRLGNLVFAQTPQASGDIIVSIFLRGGMDALSFLAPYLDPFYIENRPQLSLRSADVVDINGYFGLHNGAARLAELYNAKNLALIPACGFPEGNRSHFESQDIMDRGSVSGNSSVGWLARHMNPYQQIDSVFKAVSISNSISTSLNGYNGSLSMQNAGDFKFNSHWEHADDYRRALNTMYDNDADLRGLAKRTFDAVDILEANAPGTYNPQNGAVYPNNTFGNNLKSIAQIIRMGLGMEAATVDLGGWDTHESQSPGSGDPDGGYFYDQVKTLADGIHALWTDLQDKQGKLTILVMSEFGRRFRENTNRGTDHGHGGIMMVVSSGIREKKVYGAWPGLSREQLFESVDVQVTTDFREVLAEILRARRGLSIEQAAQLFPGFSYGRTVGFLLPQATFEPPIVSAAENWDLFR